MRQAKYGLILYVVLMIPPLVIKFESIMVTHMLVQIPLFIFSGWLMGQYFIKRFPHFFEKWNSNGVPGIILFIIITTYWMIPRVMDEALTHSLVEGFKFIGLPFLVGVPLRDSWEKIKDIGKGFVIFNYIPMFAFMAWLYIDSPIQICNNYLEAEQKHLGWGFLAITAGMLIYIVQSVFIDHSDYE